MQSDHAQVLWHASAVAERDSALKQADSKACELSQVRESSTALQQQLHVMTLEKQSDADKSAKVLSHCDYCDLSPACFINLISS